MHTVGETESTSDQVSPWGLKQHGYESIGRTPPLRTECDRRRDRGIMVSPACRWRSHTSQAFAAISSDNKAEWMMFDTHIWTEILRHLSISDLVSVSGVCKRMWEVSQYDSVWKFHLSRLKEGDVYHIGEVRAERCKLMAHSNHSNHNYSKFGNIVCIDPFHVINPNSYAKSKNKMRHPEKQNRPAKKQVLRTLYNMIRESVESQSMQYYNNHMGRMRRTKKLYMCALKAYPRPSIIN